MSIRPKPLDRSLNDRRAGSLGFAATVQRLDLGAELAASRSDLVEVRLVAAGEHDLRPSACEHLGGKRAEGPGRAGDDRHLAADIEQRQRILEHPVHGLTPGG